MKRSSKSEKFLLLALLNDKKILAIFRRTIKSFYKYVGHKYSKKELERDILIAVVRYWYSEIHAKEKK